MASVPATSRFFLVLILMLGEGLHAQFEHYDQQDTSMEAMAPASLPKAAPRRPPYLRFMLLPATNGEEVEARPAAVRYVLGGMRGKRGGGGCLGRCLRMQIRCSTLLSATHFVKQLLICFENE